MKTNYKNLALAASILFVPLKSERAVQPAVKSAKQTTFNTSFTDIYKQDSTRIADFIKRPVQMLKEADIRFAMNFPKVPKPSVNMDITKTKYVGSPKFLDMFLMGGVMEGKGKHFCEAQEKYGINAAFLVSIANHESWYGKSDYALKRNNIAGMRDKNGYMYFDSVDECIDRMAENLKRNYTDKGLTTISQINKRYAESNEWSEYIMKHMTPLYNASKAMIYNF